jgi:hypothetical protein
LQIAKPWVVGAAWVQLKEDCECFFWPALPD